MLEFRDWTALLALELCNAVITQVVVTLATMVLDSLAISMAQSSSFRHQYKSLNSGWNNITAVGFKNLLNKEFPQLKQLNLCAYLVSKIETKLVMRECK